MVMSRATVVMAAIIIFMDGMVFGWQIDRMLPPNPTYQAEPWRIAVALLAAAMCTVGLALLTKPSTNTVERSEQ